jgi:4-alpha-glucanotransferase
VGAPPVAPGDKVQDWGLPAYEWGALRGSDFGWLRARAERAGALFNLLRIDHVAGYYRTFVRAVGGPDGDGWFMPGDENSQQQLGEAVMRLYRHYGEVVAEDLGSLPGYLRPSLERLGIPGYRVLRWEKENDRFRDPAGWPALSVATNGTHDTDSQADWYDGLSPAERATLIADVPALHGLDPQQRFDDRVRDALLSAIASAGSALSLVSIQDALGTRERINVPGQAEGNWRYRLATDIETLRADTATNERLSRIAADSKRAISGDDD